MSTTINAELAKPAESGGATNNTKPETHETNTPRSIAVVSGFTDLFTTINAEPAEPAEKL